MATLGYHCSHEQYAPSVLLKWVKAASAAGFGTAMCSDHFQPWLERQGQSGFAWSWLGAALEATALTLGTVCAPGQRYHPAIIAQAVATLSEMYPDRFWLAVGSGEALNESMTGAPWMDKVQRQDRLVESVNIMRALWAGEIVSHTGYVKVNEARLYSRPVKLPAIFGACLSAPTAEWMGGWADGLITIAQRREQMKDIVDAFRRGGGNNKPIYLQVALSFAETHDEALRAAYEEWRQAALAPVQLVSLATPVAFEAATACIHPEVMGNSIRVSSSVTQHLDWLLEDADLGFDHLFLHNVHRDQARFIEVFSEHVLPAFRIHR